MKKRFRPDRILPKTQLARVVLAAVLACVLAPAAADTVPVRFREGLVHGFLALRTEDGRTIADGRMLQVADGNTVTTRLVFHFKDGSLEDETAVFTQQDVIRLVSSKLLQKGPAFPRTLEMTIDASTGRVSVRHGEGDDVEVHSEIMELPPDLTTGQLLLTQLKNLKPDAPPLHLSLLVATPKPRLLAVTVEREARDAFFLAGARDEATRYRVRARLGGLKGAFATLLDKQPLDAHVWILHGVAPAFVMSESQHYQDGPVWRIELVSPTWPVGERATAER